ncbi:MAG: phosphoribosylamine--glycine ligase [Chitinophagales bacterium]
MKIAIIGSGGREHALAWKFAQSVSEDNVYVLPGNGGTKNNVAIEVTDFVAIKAFCEKEGIGLIFVGPEVPLAKGIVDYFKDSPIQVFGPSQKAAIMEGSKIWSKQFMQKYGVATGDFWVPETKEEAQKIIAKLDGYCVLKYDGLAAGKGVFVCKTEKEALESLEELMGKYGADAPYLIEERLEGDEISIIGFTDGKAIKLFPPSQDHKQLLDGDLGPNTGGMGAFCPVPFCDDTLLQSIDELIVQPTLRGIQGEELDYKGVIYFGVMVTPNGVKVLEYNARFGDPETEILLPALKSDLLQLVQACLNGRLSHFDIVFEDGYFVDVVLASGGYPKAYNKGYPISGLDQITDGAKVFHAGTKKRADGTIVTNGGRVLNVVAKGASLADAIHHAYAQVDGIEFKDMYYRKDIGNRKGA